MRLALGEVGQWGKFSRTPAPEQGGFEYAVAELRVFWQDGAVAVGPEHVFVSSAFKAVLAVVAEAAQNAAQGLRAGTEPGAAAVVFKADDGAELRLKGEIADHALLRTLRREVEDVQAGAACPCGGVIVVAHELVAAADAEKDRPVLRGGADIRAAAEDGAVFLCVCGGYQLMGHYYDTAAGTRCTGLDVLDLTTEGAEERMIGNFAFETEFGPVVGFENHSGRTRLGPGAKPLGRVLRGFGNNGEDGFEGARYKNVFGTYSHGPVLPKNPEFCDGILKTALLRRWGSAELAPLPDLSEREAHDSVLAKILGQS